jgi:hypothetical protein
VSERHLARKPGKRAAGRRANPDRRCKTIFGRAGILTETPPLVLAVFYRGSVGRDRKKTMYSHIDVSLERMMYKDYHHGATSVKLLRYDRKIIIKLGHIGLKNPNPYLSRYPQRGKPAPGGCMSGLEA